MPIYVCHWRDTTYDIAIQQVVSRVLAQVSAANSRHLQTPVRKHALLIWIAAVGLLRAGRRQNTRLETCVPPKLWNYWKTKRMIDISNNSSGFFQHSLKNNTCVQMIYCGGPEVGKGFSKICWNTHILFKLIWRAPKVFVHTHNIHDPKIHNTT